MAKKTMSRVYARDSMERFGDDLTELILSYLYINDKVKFECLSKQWQRVIFNKQTEVNTCILSPNTVLHNPFHVLYISMSETTYLKRLNREITVLESVLKKCPNICRVYLSISSFNEKFYVYTKYCRRITKLTIPADINQTTLKPMATKHGKWLEEFTYGSSISSCYIRQFLQMCPNIKKINTHIHDNNNNILVDKSFTMLEVIRCVWIYGNQSLVLELLVGKYGKSLKGLEVVFVQLSTNDLKTCFAHISRFESLESLDINFDYPCPFTEPIDDCLKLLANKCTKLRELRFNIYDKVFTTLISNRFFYAFTDFRSLERLVLDFSKITKKLDGNVECFKHMTRLKHLSIYLLTTNSRLFRQHSDNSA